MAIRPSFKDSTKINSKALIIFGCLLAVAIGVYLASIPLRQSLAQKFLQRGEEKLAEAKYIEALVEFRKSDWLAKGGAEEQISTANQMQQDIQAGEIYFRKYQKNAILEALRQSQKIPESESSGLKKVKAEIEDNNPQIAELSAEILIEMDDKSPKAWAYLGIARLQSARLVQMTEDNRKAKLLQAKDAFQTATRLDSEDKLSLKYISEVENLL